MSDKITAGINKAVQNALDTKMTFGYYPSNNIDYQPPSTCIIAGVVDNQGYITFEMGWITFQLRVFTYGQVHYRSKYGSNDWSNWNAL